MQSNTELPSLRTRAAVGLAALALCLFAPSCATPNYQEGRRSSAEDDLKERAEGKGWIDFTHEPDPEKRSLLVKDAIERSRSPMALYYDRVLAQADALRIAAAKGRTLESGSADQDAAETRPTSRPADGFSFEFRDAPLKEVVYLVAGELGWNILVPVAMPERVTVSFPSIDARRGLEAILVRYGYELKDERGVWSVDKTPAAPLVTKTFSMKTGLKLDVEKQILPLLGARGSVSTEPENRALIVTAEQSGIDAVGRYLDILDKRPRQVLIEALIIEVARSNTEKRGARVRVNGIEGLNSVTRMNSELLPTPDAAGINPFSVGFISTKNAIEVLLAADDSINRLNVLHSPFVSTASGKNAKLRVVESIPYIRATTSIGAAGGASTGTVTSTQEIEFEEAGVTLDVLPQIGDDDIIDVVVKPKIEELVNFIQGVPVIDTREAETSIMVRNKETIVIGGLLRNSFSELSTKVPILGDIPLLGELFKKSERTDEKIELLIFLTPRILSYGNEAYDGYRPADDMLGQDKPYMHIDDVLRREKRDEFRASDDPKH